MIGFDSIGQIVGCCTSLTRIPSVLLRDQHFLVHKCRSFHWIENQLIKSSLMGFWQRVPYLFAFIRNTVILLYSAFCLIIIYKREVSIRHPLLNMFIIPFISPSHCLRLVLEAQMIIAIHYIFNIFPIPFTEYGNQKVHLMIVYVIKIELINIPGHVQKSFHTQLTRFDISYIQ